MHLHKDLIYSSNKQNSAQGSVYFVKDSSFNLRKDVDANQAPALKEKILKIVMHCFFINLHTLVPEIIASCLLIRV